MVLQDVDNPTPDDFTDNPYPSENDPYATQSTTGFRFDPTVMPQPLPIVGLFMGYSARNIRVKVETTMKFAERKVGRALTPEESQALAFHLYQIEQTSSYFGATGVALGTVRWYTTWDKVRYPFYQPKVENINPNKFSFIRGPLAQVVRHSWRFTLYAFVAGTMGNILGGMVAQPLAAVNSSKDPKLEKFGTDLKAAAAQAMDQRRGQEGDIQQRRREFQEQVRNRNGGGPSPQARWGRQAPVKSEEDDSSPTAGNEAWGSASPAAESWESYSNETPQPASQRQQSRPSEEARNRRPPPQPSQAPAPLPFDDDDDASPTGGLFQDEVNNPQSQSQPQLRPGESSWDRLRRGGPLAPLQRPPHQQSRRAELRRKEQSDAGMGDAFGKSDEDRKMEREQAQQEFDAKLERERQGRDFESDGGKRW